jgi:environmental stress-induced protein Ves
MTTEIACAPPGAGLDEFSWRVSTAEVAGDGPFSCFPGVERVMVIVSGTGLVLSVDGVDHRLEPLEPFAFPGDAHSSARVPGGPVRDLNFMARRNLTSAQVEVVGFGPNGRVPVAAREDLIVVAVSGVVELRVDHLASAARGGTEPETWTLDPLDATHCRGPGVLAVSGPATVVLGRFTPTAPTPG